jgi:hypothetical protein
MPARAALRVCVTAFPLGGRIWRGGVAHPICPSEEHLVGELLQDAAFSDGEDIRDSRVDPLKVSLVHAGRLTFGHPAACGCCLPDHEAVPVPVPSKGRKL